MLSFSEPSQVLHVPLKNLMQVNCQLIPGATEKGLICVLGEKIQRNESQMVEFLLSVIIMGSGEDDSYRLLSPMSQVYCIHCATTALEGRPYSSFSGDSETFCTWIC